MVGPINPGTGKVPRFDTSKLKAEHKQLLDETLQIMQQDKYSAAMLSKVAELGTPVRFGNDGLNGAQAAGTQIKSNGTSKVDLGTSVIDKAKTKTDKMKAIAGMIGNEFGSVIYAASAAKKGNGIQNMQSKAHEEATFHLDGYQQALIESKVGNGGAGAGVAAAGGESGVTFKDAKAQVEKEYGTAIQNVMNKASSYAKLPPGSVQGSGLDEWAQEGILPEAFVQEAKQGLTSVKGAKGAAGAGAGAAKTGKMSKISFDELKEQGVTQGSDRQDASIPSQPRTARKPEQDGKGDIALKP